jgi:tRNA (adenine22-N1)-methyltransferase
VPGFIIEQAFCLKLSKRLQQIEHMVTADYSHIWDCCCDHGFLGAALLSRQAANTVHFVDIVPQLIAELNSKLYQHYPDSSWQTHCLDVANLPLADYEGTHLVIIAGVGGDLMIKFVKAIYQQYPRLHINFLLCPVHHHFALRRSLIELEFSLQHEVLVEDNQRFYEIILVSSAADSTRKISEVGDKIWHAKSVQLAEIAANYLHNTLNHYQRIQHGNNANVQHIIDAYRSVKLR